MPDEQLNFNPDDLGGFDRARNPGDDDLSAFDAASGATFVPPGWYECRLEAGTLFTTSTGKPAYSLRFAVIEPAEHVPFLLWRNCLLDAANANRSKAMLAPLGLRTGADLKELFPKPGRTIRCRVLVTMQKNDRTRNDVQRFTVERDDRDDGHAAARFALPADASKEGGIA